MIVLYVMNCVLRHVRRVSYLIISVLLLLSIGSPALMSDSSERIDVQGGYTLITLDPADLKGGVDAGESVVIEFLGMAIELRLFVREFVARSVLESEGRTPFTYEGYANGSGYARFVLREDHIRGSVRLSGWRYIVDPLEEYTRNPDDRHTYVTYAMSDPFTEGGVPDGWQPLIARAEARSFRDLEVSTAADQDFRAEHGQDWQGDIDEVLYYSEEAYYYGILKYDFIIVDHLAFTRTKTSSTDILKEYADWMNGTRGDDHDVGQLFLYDEGGGGLGNKQGFEYRDDCSLNDVAWCVYSQQYESSNFWVWVDKVSHEIGHNLADNAQDLHDYGQKWGSTPWVSVMWPVREDGQSGWITDGSRYAKNRHGEYGYWNNTQYISDYSDPKI